MTSNTAMDTLLAALYPHIAEYLWGTSITASKSLEPSKGPTASAICDVVDSFTTLFGLFPKCETVALAAQTSSPNNVTLYVCPSPPIPDGFDINAKKCFARFMEMRRADSASSASRDGTLSLPAQHFIVDSYTTCYPAMRQCAIRADKTWKFLIQPDEPEGEERQLREEVSENLARLSTLLKSFVETLRLSEGRDELGDDETLQFHSLCLEICDEMRKDPLKEYINEYLYLMGVEPLISWFFGLPVALCKLVALASSPHLEFDCELPIVIVEPLPQARDFRATLTAQHLEEALKEGQKYGIAWKDVEHAFCIQKNFGKGVEWDAENRVLSSLGPVVPHAEVRLIQYLLETATKADVKDKPDVYIACSSASCYASVMYAGIVNDVLAKCRFTMRTDDDSDWCRLYSAPPWTLSENTEAEVARKMKDRLLRELAWTIDDWRINGGWRR
ncbi:hypothetical protein V8D89_001390 [Ganoderma adspersum]